MEFEKEAYKEQRGWSSTPCELCGFQPKTKNKYREKLDHLVLKHFRDQLNNLLPQTRPFICPFENCIYEGKDKQAVQRHFCKHGILEKLLKEALEENKSKQDKNDQILTNSQMQNIAVSQIGKGELFCMKKRALKRKLEDEFNRFGKKQQQNDQDQQRQLQNPGENVQDQQRLLQHLGYHVKDQQRLLQHPGDHVQDQQRQLHHPGDHVQDQQRLLQHPGDHIRSLRDLEDNVQDQQKKPLKLLGDHIEKPIVACAQDQQRPLGVNVQNIHQNRTPGVSILKKFENLKNEILSIVSNVEVKQVILKELQNFEIDAFASVTNLRNENEKLEKNQLNLKNENEKLRCERAQYVHKSQVKHQKINELNVMIDNLSEKLQQNPGLNAENFLQQDILKKKNEMLETQNEKLKQNENNVRNKNKELIEENAKLRNEFQNERRLQHFFTKKIELLETKNKKMLENETKSLSDDMKQQQDLKNEIERLKTQNEKLQENQTNVQNQSDALIAANDNLLDELKRSRKKIEILTTQSEKLQENQNRVKDKSYKLVAENEYMLKLLNELNKKIKVLKTENEKFQENSIRKEIDNNSKINYLECRIEKLEETQTNLQDKNDKLNVENEKFLERIQMVGKIFNEVSGFNIETKNLIEKVNSALGRPLLEPFDAAIYLTSEIAKEIKMEVDDSKFDQDPDQRTIYFDFD